MKPDVVVKIFNLRIYMPLEYLLINYFKKILIPLS